MKKKKTRWVQLHQNFKNLLIQENRKIKRQAAVQLKIAIKYIFNKELISRTMKIFYNLILRKTPKNYVYNMWKETANKCQGQEDQQNKINKNEWK